MLLQVHLWDEIYPLNDEKIDSKILESSTLGATAAPHSILRLKNAPKTQRKVHFAPETKSDEETKPNEYKINCMMLKSKKSKDFEKSRSNATDGFFSTSDFKAHDI